MKNKLLCILVINDCVGALDLIRLALKATTQWRVFTCTSTHEGLIQARRESPDIILLDFQMPQMNGIDMAIKLQSHPKTVAIPILLLTSLPHAVSLGVFHKFGITGIVKKPFNWFVLADLIVWSLGAYKKESDSLHLVKQ